MIYGFCFSFRWACGSSESLINEIILIYDLELQLLKVLTKARFTTEMGNMKTLGKFAWKTVD